MSKYYSGTERAVLISNIKKTTMGTSALLCLFLVGQATTSQPFLTTEGETHSIAMGDRLQRMESQLLAQDTRLARQETLLSQQNDRIVQQELELSRQDSLLRRYEETLSRQDSLNRQQGVELTRLTVLLSRYEKRQEADRLNGGIQSSHEDQASSAAQGDTGEWTYTASHQVMTRSDDVSPLEAVVSGVSDKVSALTADLEALRDANSERDADIQDARTSTFVRWGSSSCPASSQLVYTGAMGGSWYLHTGAATNYLCLTLHPVARPAPRADLAALLYGVEFQTHDSHHNTDPVCSVCRSSFSTTIMMPGSNVCPDGWNQQYSGYIMAGNYLYESGSQYLCMDSQMETRPGGNGNDNGRLLDYTITRCGSLPCGPYANNTMVTCAVCSK